MNVTSADDFVGSNSRIAAVNGGGAFSHGAEVDGQRAIAEVQAAMAVAKRFPRDTVAARERVLNACARPGLAKTAVYQFARGGSDISGPSIRLAEAVAQQWGNLKFGIVEKESGAKGSLVEAFCWDLETNVYVAKTFLVPHVRHTKHGSKPLTDPRDIYENVANNGARRLRACILGVIPGDVIEEAVAACEKTLLTTCDCGPEAQKNLIAKFREIGVSRDQIEARIQRRIEAIQPAQIVSLRNIYLSIRDGMSIITDWFDPVPTGDGSGKPGAKTETVVDPTADALNNAKGTAPAERPGKKAAETKSESPAAEPPQQ